MTATLLGAYTLAGSTVVGGADLAETLGQRSQRMGVLLLIAIPSIHLAQRLTLAILLERETTEEARHRSKLLEAVAESSQRVGRLDAGMVDEVLQSALLLGLDIVDVCVRGGDGRWRVEASMHSTANIHLPEPNGPIGCVSAAETGQVVQLVSGRTPGADALLLRVGVGAMVACALGTEGPSTVVLRGAIAPDSILTKTVTD